MPISRFVDNGKLLGAFADEVLVVCLCCGTPGRVTATWSPYRWSAQFRCSSCGVSLSSEAGDWVGPVVVAGRRPCGKCGHKWLTVRKCFNRLPEQASECIPAQCTECGHTSDVQVTSHRALESGSGFDPHFGMPLYLSQDCRFGPVWAYNERHLCELIYYVEAKLRVRQGGGNKAMFSRLPKWMKLAKNREPVLKVLKRLGSQLSNHSVERVVSGKPEAAAHVDR